MTKSPSDWEPVRYCVDTDTMAIELRPWPGQPGEAGEGEDAGTDLVIHFYPGDGKPWLWEIEHASQHPEYITAALIKVDGWQTAIREMRGGQQKAQTEGKDDIVNLSADVLSPMVRPGARATYYRKVAAQMRDLASRAQLPEEDRREMADLAEGFDTMAKYFEWKEWQASTT